MDNTDALHREIKDLLVNNLMLQMTAAEIADDLPLFGPEGLGLDSVDALQIVVALDKDYGLKIAEANVARDILQTVRTIAAAVAQHREQTSRATMSASATEGTTPT